MCWYVPAACASMRLRVSPQSISLVGLHALSSAGESGGDSPRLLVTGWLCYRPITDYSLGLAALDATADAADAVRWRR